jgi:hypothetical protein
MAGFNFNKFPEQKSRKFIPLSEIKRMAQRICKNSENHRLLDVKSMGSIFRNLDIQGLVDEPHFL